MLHEVTQCENLPYPIGLHRIVCYGDYGIYLIGGATYIGASNGSSTTSNDVYNAQMYKFNLSTRKWTKMASIIPSFTDEHAAMVNVKRKPDNSNIVLVSRCAAFLDRKRLIIAGGRLISRDFNIASYSTYVYDVQNQTTTELSIKSSSTSDPNERGIEKLPTAHRDFFDQTMLRWRDSYVLCSRILDERSGRKKFLFHLLINYNDDNENSDDKMISWQDLSPNSSNAAEINGSIGEPLTGDLCELAIYDDFIYCIDKNDVENCLDVQWRYDLQNRKWECVESTPDYSQPISSNQTSAMMMIPQGKPIDRMFASCITYDDSVYVVGGSAMTWAGPKSNPVLSDIWRLHLPTLQWSLMPVRLPEGLWFHSIDVSPSGCMYIFGGFTDLTGRKPTSKLWRLYLNSPPSLSSLTWRILLKINRFNLNEKSDDELRNMRIPLCYVSALRW